MAMMGIGGPPASAARIRRVASSPSITGIWMSMKRASKLPSDWRVAMARAPSSATTTSIPAPARSSWATCWLMGLSSTTRTRTPEKSGAPAAAASIPPASIPPASPNSSRIALKSADCFTGLNTKASTPASRAPWISSSRRKVVTMRMGGLRVSRRDRIWRAARMSSRPGTRQSRITRSAGGEVVSSAAVRAVSSSTGVTEKEKDFSIRTMASREVA